MFGITFPQFHFCACVCVRPPSPMTKSAKALRKGPSEGSVEGVSMKLNCFHGLDFDVVCLKCLDVVVVFTCLSVVPGPC